MLYFIEPHCKGISYMSFICRYLFNGFRAVLTWCGDFCISGCQRASKFFCFRYLLHSSGPHDFDIIWLLDNCYYNMFLILSSVIFLELLLNCFFNLLSFIHCNPLISIQIYILFIWEICFEVFNSGTNITKFMC